MRRYCTFIMAAVLGTASLSGVKAFATAPVPSPALAQDTFPEPAGIASQVAFWTRVYVEIDTGAGFIHDDRHLTVVYETLPVSTHRATRSVQVKARKRHWQSVLERLGSGAPGSGPDARRAAELWRAALSQPPTPKHFREAAERLRFQLGQRNRFEAGLIRAGRYERRIRDILRDAGLPEDLAYLPHVESSFNTHAWSRSGAAGMWQFIPATGRRYLQIDDVIDERLDPIKASHAAAALLRHNFRRLGTWPLAITAYNHGASGMRRAQRGLGTNDIVRIIEHYDGRTFGFASRNFYAQFLAARRVARDEVEHFGPLQRDGVESVRIVRLPFYADSSDVVEALGIDRKEFAFLNPSLRRDVFRSRKYIPPGFALRLPDDVPLARAEGLGTAIPAARRFDGQRAPRIHRVRRGDTLGHIARRYGTSVSRLVTINRLDSAHRIRVGQTLEVAAAGAAASPAM